MKENKINQKCKCIGNEELGVFIDKLEKLEKDEL